MKAIRHLNASAFWDVLTMRSLPVGLVFKLSIFFKKFRLYNKIVFLVQNSISIKTEVLVKQPLFCEDRISVFEISLYNKRTTLNNPHHEGDLCACYSKPRYLRKWTVVTANLKVISAAPCIVGNFDALTLLAVI